MKKHYSPLILTLLFFFAGKGFCIDLSSYRFHTIPATPYYHGIYSIVKDSIGRIWYNGSTIIFMYDGVSFKQMDDRITSKSPDFSWQFGDLVMDNKKNLFVSTNNGLFQLDYDSLKFNQICTGNILVVSQGESGIIWFHRNRKIESFSTDKNYIPESYDLPEKASPSYLTEIRGDIYFGTYPGEIYKLNKKKKTFDLLFHISEGYVRHIIEYNGDFIVLTQNHGLYFLDQQGNIKKHYPLKFNMNESINSKKLYVDSFGVLWVGTQLGIQLIDLRTGEQDLLHSNLNDPLSLPHNSIWSISPDPDGGIWVGTFGGKLSFVNFNDNRVNYRTATKGGLNNSVVSCFEEDKDGNIWIGTEGGGLNFWDRKKDEFTYYIHQSKNSVNFNLIKVLHYDESHENLRIASYNGGINIYNTKTKTFHDLKIHTPGSDSRYLNVYDFLLQGDSGIWTSEPERGLYYVSLKTNKTRQITLSDTTGQLQTNPQIVKLMRASEDQLYLFTRMGLYLFDTRKELITEHFLIRNSQYASNIINCCCMTSSSDLWIGTRGGGVNLFSKDGTYRNFNKDSGFDANTVFSILEDKSTQYIWMATDNGLICYDSFQNQFRKIDIVHSSIYGSFYPQSCFQTSSGDMLFGGTNGFVIFNPSKMRINKQLPKVFLSKFLIDNREVVPGGEKSPLPKDISVLTSTGKIQDKSQFKLSHKQTNIGFQFASNSYLENNKNQYACRLSGISDEWQVLPIGQSYIQYSNLPPGSYTFEVKAANNDGVWGEKSTGLCFVVKPAPWFSLVAYLFYFFIFLSIMYLIWKYFSNRKEFSYKIKLERIEKEKINEITQMRINFFTNISHDLKTPLTLIIDPLKRLEKTISPEHQGNSYIELIEQNVRRIQRMINQLLEFRRIESKKINLEFQTGDIIEYTSELFRLFIPYARDKHMFTEIDTFTSHLKVQLDPDLIEKIFSNLFSNAVKYSPEGESIIFKISTATEEEKAILTQDKSHTSNFLYLTFDVINTGTTINPKQVENLFESFQQLSAKKTTIQRSTGLGLSIAKELIQALNGIIQPIIRPDEVIFRVILPFTLVVNTGETKIIQEATDTEVPDYQYTLSELKALQEYPSALRKEGKRNNEQHKLVVIEDDETLKNYIVKELSEIFTVYSAKDGQEGINLVKKINPQVIISDLMMPGLDGFEVCKQLKNNLKTSHIPIIMLSAIANQDKRLSSLKEGADVFIEKPFDLDFLIQQIKNLIESRENLKKIYSQKYIVEPSQVVVTSVDEIFFKKAVSFVEKNIQNPDYDVENFVSDMATSRTLLYRKINEATGMSIKEFILDMRMKRAAQLLRDSHYNVSEISVMVGFNDSKYFSTSFKKHYGMPPSEFKNSER
ncbi:MAG: response regulator [Dysgonamonadaceae bacterium]|jgi:signal transduction histidine kinase/DNA-binding response OmpR family regulator/ligand-binding sensor domain-containing protein|nr:response regulator [Dysgonamonadaceae bacterium]